VTSKQPRKAPMASSSANTQRLQQQSNFEMSAVDFPSPTKSMTMHTGGAGGISPWRIKVTVEAEPEFDGSDEENIGYRSPTRSHTTRTTTTKIPLKDLHPSSPVKRRGRPRKSDASLTAKPKRSGTPARRKSKARNSSVGVADDSIPDVSINNVSAAPKKRRGRPRKNLQSEADIIPQKNHNNTCSENILQDPQFEATASPDEDRSFKNNASERTSFDCSNLEPLREKYPVEEHIQKLETRLYDQEIRRRVPTPANPRGLPEGERQLQQLQGGIRHEQDEESILGSQRKRNETSFSDNYRSTPISVNGGSKEKSKSPSSPENENLHTPSESDHNDANMWRCMVAKQRRDDEEVFEVEDNGVKDQNESSIEDADGNYELEEDNTIAYAEPDTTILEGEDFSMVSIDSLPSRQTRLSSPPYRNADINILERSTGQGVNRDSLSQPNQVSEQDHYDLPSGLSTSFMPSSTGLTPSNIRSSPPIALPRQHTPSIIAKSQSAPPPIQAQQFSPQKASTPKLVRVVKAGIALHGVLDPITEAYSGESANESSERKIDRLDDLFSGFSEGTRRELRAGLRLGEQIAKQHQQRDTSKEASPVLSGPSKIPDIKVVEDDIFNVPQKAQQSDASNPRLPTPEEKDHYVLALPPPPSERTGVEYPSLSARMQSAQLATPAKSVDEMSWQADTPQSTRCTAPKLAAGSLGQIGNVTIAQQSHITSGKCTNELDAQIQPERESVSRQTEKANSSQVIIIKDDRPEEQEGHSDIWHEEASRSSESLPCNEAATDDSARKSSPLQDPLIDSTSQLKPTRGKIPKTWRRKSSSDFSYSDKAGPGPEESRSPNTARQERTVCTEESKSKFQESKLVEEVASENDKSEESDDTGIFWQQNLPAVCRKPNSLELKGTKLDLSMLLGTNDSLLKSSPLNSPRKLSPFKNVPPKIAPLQLSPYKTSPLEQQVMSKHPENVQHVSQSLQVSRHEQSFPGRDVADDSVSLDIRQLRAEMKARPFEYHGLTLHKIEEATGHSGQQQKPINTSTSKPTDCSTRPEAAKPQSAGLFSRLTSTLWSAVTSAAPPPSHPIISHYDPLPRFEPWTKTHYKTLDAIFQYHKRHPTAFAPNTPPSLNNALLNTFSDRAKFLGAKYSCWGYSIVIDETHLVIAAVFMQLLTLQDIEEYERIAGKKIQRGSVGPGPDGKIIGAETVVRRLFTIVAGEELRKDEKEGKHVSRNGGLKIQWPNCGNGLN
jgi:hypothetical protein